MPFKKGDIGNPAGRNSHGTDALAKVQKAISNGIKKMKSPDGKSIGVVRLAEKITAALEADPIRTLKALSAYMPKNVQIDLNDHRQADSIPDSELAKLIAEGAARKIGEDDEPQTLADLH